MGERGPKPLPATLHLLKGNPSKKPIAALLGELKPEIEIPDCPEFLWEEARAEWSRLGVELFKYGLVSQLDRGLMAWGCQEWARWSWAEKKISEANKADPSGEAGLIDKAPSGYRMPSVYLQISRRSMENYETVCKHFGMSPGTRSRVIMSDNQPWLPGMNPVPAGDGEQKPGGLARFAK